MNYFPCGGKTQKIKIDGEEVNISKIEYASYGEELSEAQALHYQLICGGAVVLNNEIHVFGGYNTGNEKSHYKLNGTTWTRVSTLPINFNGKYACVVLNGEIHIFLDAYHYKWNGRTWTQLSDAPLAVNLGVVLNGEIHAIQDSDKRHYKWNGRTWTQLSDAPYLIYDGAAVVLNNEIHILGGSTTAAYSGAVAGHYKWNGRTWTQVTSMPYSVSRHKAVVLNGEIHILGGANGGTKFYASSNHYIWDGTTWRQADNLPYEFAWGSAVVSNGEIHILGGESTTNSSTLSTSEHGLKHYILNLKKYKLIIHR